MMFRLYACALLAVVSLSHAAIMHTPGTVLITPADDITPLPDTDRMWKSAPLDPSMYSCEVPHYSNDCALLFDGAPQSGMNGAASEHSCFAEGDSVTFDWGSKRAVTKVAFDNYCNDNLVGGTQINSAHNVHEIQLLTSDDGHAWTQLFWATEMVALGDDTSLPHADWTNEYHANWTINNEATCNRVELLTVARPARFLRFVVGANPVKPVVYQQACIHQLGVYGSLHKVGGLETGQHYVLPSVPFSSEDPFTHKAGSTPLLNFDRLKNAFTCESPSAGFEDDCARLFDTESGLLAYYNAEVSPPVQADWSDLSGNGNSGYLKTSSMKVSSTCRVLSVDHKSGNVGWYANFDPQCFDRQSGARLEFFSTNNVRVTRGGAVVFEGEMDMWRTPNGGSVGDGHGRRATGAAAGQWQVGDEIELIDDGGAGGYNVEFNGVSDFVQLPISKADLESRDGKWTIAIWMRFGGLITDSYRHLIGTMNSDGKPTAFSIGKNAADDRFIIQDDAASTTSVLFDGASAFDGFFHSVIISHDGTSVTLFVDGVADSNGPQPTIGGAPSAHLLALGAETSGANIYWKGDISEVLFLVRDVSAASARSIHNRMAQRMAFSMASAVDQPDVLALYSTKISNAADGVLQDLTGNHPPGVLEKVGSGGSLPVASGQTLTFTTGKVMTGITTGALRPVSGAEWTIAAWVKYTGDVASGEEWSAIVGSQVVGSYETSGSSSTDFFLGKEQSGYVCGSGKCLCMQWIGIACWTVAADFFEDGIYHSVVVISTGDTDVELFADGVSQGVKSSSSFALALNEEIAIGVEADAYPWKGDISEVVFMTRALSSSEVSTVHQRMNDGLRFIDPGAPTDAMCFEDGGSVTVLISDQDQQDPLFQLYEVAMESFCTAHDDLQHLFDRVVLTGSRDGLDWFDLGSVVNFGDQPCQWYNLELSQASLVRWLRVTVFARPGSSEICLGGIRAFGAPAQPPKPTISTPKLEMLPNVEQWFADAVNRSLSCDNCLEPGHQWDGDGARDYYQHPAQQGDGTSIFHGPFDCGASQTDTTVVRTTRLTGAVSNSAPITSSQGVVATIRDNLGNVLWGPTDVFATNYLDIDIDITHATTMKLVVNPRGTHTSDWFRWRQLKLTCSAQRPGASLEWTPQTTLKGLPKARRIAALEPHQYQCDTSDVEMSLGGFSCGTLFDGVPAGELEYFAEMRATFNKDSHWGYFFHGKCFEPGDWVQQNFDAATLVEGLAWENYCNNNNHNADNITVSTSLDGVTWHQALHVTGLNDGTWLAGACDRIQIVLDQPVLATHVRFSGTVRQDAPFAYFCLPELAFYGQAPRPSAIGPRDLQRWCSTRRHIGDTCA